VHKAYQENVPDKVSEKEFWIKYFSSQYFYRKRVAGGTGPSPSGGVEGGKGTGDLFEQYAAIDADGAFYSVPLSHHFAHTHRGDTRHGSQSHTA
jgi:hypothetical protein